MELLIKNATIIRPGARRNSSRKDIYIKNGVIEKIASNLSIPKAKIIESENLHVSAGWLDIGTQIGEPGFEHRENLQSVAKAAARGGFTAIACFPNTYPVVDNKSAVHFIKSSTSKSLVDFYPIAALSMGTEGADITEMLDLHKNGAVAFSDGAKSVQDSGVLLRALQYIKSFDGTIIHRSIDQKIASGGQVHEGELSIMLGMKGIPAIAESSSLHKDVALNEYADSKIIFHTLSSADSCKVVKAAKKNKQQVFATAAYLNLVASEQELKEFNSQYKTTPPLRSIQDQNALVRGIKDGTIDAICSNHVPLEEERKKLEFSYADFGAIGLQTLFPALYESCRNKISLSVLVEKLSNGPRGILGLPQIKIKTGEKAELTLFDPDKPWVFDQKCNESRSSNSPFLDKRFDSCVLGIINGKNHNL